MNRFLAALTILLASVAMSQAQQPLIGVVGPLSGPQEILGRQIVTGASAASEAAGAAIATADDQCTAAGGAAVARQMVERKPAAVIGFLCTESLEAALPMLKDAGIPVISVGVRSDGMTDRHVKTQWPLLRLAPRSDAEADAVASMLPPLWRERNFAIVDDGTVGGRDLAEAFRAAAERDSLKPVFVDTYRPELDNQVALIGRLRRSGATHVFVGGNRRDVAIMARDAKARGYNLTLAGGESLRTDDSDVPLASGVLMVGLPEWVEIATPTVLGKLSSVSILPEGYVLPAYAATEIVLAANAARPAAFAAYLGRPFVTAIGPVTFDPKGDATPSRYALFRFNGQTFVPLESN